MSSLSLSISGDSGNIDVIGGTMVPDGGPDGAMAPAGQSLVEARGGAIMAIGSPGAPGGGNTFVITAESYQPDNKIGAKFWTSGQKIMI